MKNIATIVLSFVFFSGASGQGFTDKVYLPNPTTGLAATCCTTSSTLPDWYVNLEKYWYYRYMAVNDYIYVGTEAGESIPAATRQMTYGRHPTPKNRGAYPLHYSPTKRNR